MSEIACPLFEGKYFDVCAVLPDEHGQPQELIALVHKNTYLSLFHAPSTALNSLIRINLYLHKFFPNLGLCTNLASVNWYAERTEEGKAFLAYYRKVLNSGELPTL